MRQAPDAGRGATSTPAVAVRSAVAIAASVAFDLAAETTGIAAPTARVVKAIASSSSADPFRTKGSDAVSSPSTSVVARTDRGGTGRPAAAATSKGRSRAVGSPSREAFGAPGGTRSRNRPAA